MVPHAAKIAPRASFPFFKKDEARQFLRAVLGDRPGQIAVALGYHGRWVNEAYRHSEWIELRFDSIAELLDEVERELLVQRVDVYVCPARRRHDVRHSRDAVSLRWLWADLDDVTGEAQDLLDRLGAMRIHSGQGVHAYIHLAYAVSADSHRWLNWALAKAMGADSKWSDESLLRLPGTLNWKSGAGTPVEVVQPVAEVHDPVELGRLLGVRTVVRDTSADDLPARIRVALKAPAGDRSEAVARIVNWAVGEGWSDREIAELLARNQVGQRYTDRHALRTDIARLRRSYAGPVKFTSAEHIGLADQAVTTMTGTLRKVLRARQARAAEAGEGRYSVSCRELALHAGVSSRTAVTGTRRLIEQGWLIRLSTPTNGCATAYRLTLPEEVRKGLIAASEGAQQVHTPPATPSGGVDGGVSKVSPLDVPADLDGVRWQAIGGSYRWLRYVSDVPKTRKTLMEETGASRATVTRHLGKLRKAGLIELTNGGYVCSAEWEMKLEELAVAKGTTGMRARAELQLRQDRDARKAAQIYTAQQHGREYRDAHHIVVESTGELIATVTSTRMSAAVVGHLKALQGVDQDEMIGPVVLTLADRSYVCRDEAMVEVEFGPVA